MDIFDTWKAYKEKMESYILKFNTCNKENDFEGMTKNKESTKTVYLKFIELLKLEPKSNQEAFREALD